MPIQIEGLAQTLARCLDFEGVAPEALEAVLIETGLPLQLRVAEPSSETPLIASGSAFTQLYFVQHGTLAPWQFPHSELAAPFLVGIHELLMDAERWVGSYSAVDEAVVVGIPIGVMTRVVERIPSVRERMHELLMRRLSRFYWVSLATNGSPSARVAAALVSRLALDDLDFGGDRTIAMRQKDIGRLTTMSRSAVAAGLAELAEAGAITWGDAASGRFKGEVSVPDVESLKERAFRDVREREIGPLIAGRSQD